MFMAVFVPKHSLGTTPESGRMGKGPTQGTIPHHERQERLHRICLLPIVNGPDATSVAPTGKNGHGEFEFQR